MGDDKVAKLRRWIHSLVIGMLEVCYFRMPSDFDEASFYSSRF